MNGDNISLTYLLPARRAGTVLRLGICGSVRPSVRPFLKMVQSTSTTDHNVSRICLLCLALQIVLSEFKFEHAYLPDGKQTDV